MTEALLTTPSADTQEHPPALEARQPQWEGDQGTLSMPIRRLLVKLVTGPYVSASEHRNLWATLMENEALVRSRLNDLCVELRLDVEMGIAFARNVNTEEDVPKLMRSQSLTHAQTMLVVRLRQLHLQAAAAGLDAYVTRDEMIEILRPYLERVDKRDDAQIVKRAASAIEKMKDYSFLIPTDKDEQERFRIGNIIALVIDADAAGAIWNQYRAQIEAHSEPSNSEGQQ